MITTLDYVRIDGDACDIATPEHVEIARRVMRERGIKSLPILRGTIHAADVPTGLRLRATVTGVPTSQPCARCGEWIGNAASIAGACTGCGVAVRS